MLLHAQALFLKHTLVPTRCHQRTGRHNQRQGGRRQNVTMPEGCSPRNLAPVFAVDKEAAGSVREGVDFVEDALGTDCNNSGKTWCSSDQGHKLTARRHVGSLQKSGTNLTGQRHPRCPK